MHSPHSIRAVALRGTLIDFDKAFDRVEAVAVPGL